MTSRAQWNFKFSKITPKGGRLCDWFHHCWQASTALEAYFEGLHRGDVSRMKEVWHSEGHLYWADSQGELVDRDASKFFVAWMRFDGGAVVATSQKWPKNPLVRRASCGGKCSQTCRDYSGWWTMIISVPPDRMSYRRFVGMTRYGMDNLNKYSLAKYFHWSWCSSQLGGGFEYVWCSSQFGEDSHVDYYFSDGLKPPTTQSHHLLAAALCFLFRFHPKQTMSRPSYHLDQP